MPEISTEERVARYMAAEDWMEDAADDEWWASRIPKFRADYLASARKVIAIVQQWPVAPPVHLAKGTNAEDCPGCAGTNPPYPFICPGPERQPTEEATRV